MSMRVKKFCITAICLILIVFSSSAQAGGTGGEVQFVAIGKPSAIRIVGKESGIQNQFTLSGLALSGTSKVLLDGFTTGIAKRDEHMKKKYLETDKFSEAVFQLNTLSLPAAFQSEEAKAEGVPFTGKLKLHGVEKDISGSADIKKVKEKILVNAKFKFGVQDFNIAIPSFAGITVTDQIEIEVKLETTPEKK